MVKYKIYISCMFLLKRLQFFSTLLPCNGVPVVLYLAFYSMDKVLADFWGYLGLFEEYLWGDTQDIHILYVFAYSEF